MAEPHLDTPHLPRTDADPDAKSPGVARIEAISSMFKRWHFWVLFVGIFLVSCTSSHPLPTSPLPSLPSVLAVRQLADARPLAQSPTA